MYVPYFSSHYEQVSQEYDVLIGLHTSIIAFVRKSEKLYLKFKEPPMLKYIVSKNVTDWLNALYLVE